jgi:hypothetical protein
MRGLEHADKRDDTEGCPCDGDECWHGETAPLKTFPQLKLITADVDRVSLILSNLSRAMLAVVDLKGAKI